MPFSDTIFSLMVFTSYSRNKYTRRYMIETNYYAIKAHPERPKACFHALSQILHTWAQFGKHDLNTSGGTD